MKRLFFLAAIMLAIMSCTDIKKQAREQLLNQRDSLDLIIAQKDAEIDELMATFNDIEQGFREINAAEGRVTLARKGEGESAETRIRENMQFIQQTMRQNRELIAKLRQQLHQSSLHGEQMRRTLENLTAQLAEKENMLQQLRAELDAKDIHIAELDETIADLHEDVNNLQAEGERKDETISAQDQELNTAWYVFGTKSELKEQNILRDGHVLQGNFNKDYFTRIDIRVEKEIKLFSRSAELLTTHPADSYTLERDTNKQYVLRITNAQRFWSTSKYLVIQVK